MSIFLRVWHNVFMGDLTNKKPFEAEVRFFIPNINSLKKIVEKLGCELVSKYSFTDYYYEPKFIKWDNLHQTIRIREWHVPKKSTVIYLTKEEIVQRDGYMYKQSLYPEGKLCLFSGDISICREVLIDLDFEEKGKFFHVII